MTASRFDDLLRLWREGEASEAELAELEALLRSDARYRRSLAGSIRLEIDLYARYAAAAGAVPLRRRRLEPVAAGLAVAVALLAAVFFLLRVPASPGRVLAGDVRVDGAPVRSFATGRVLEIGASAARLELRDGPSAELAPGSAGSFVDAGRFDLLRGEGRFRTSTSFRVVTSSGAVSGAAADFSVRLDGPLLRVDVGAGEVEVAFDGLRHPLRAGEAVAYGAAAKRDPGEVRADEKLAGEAAFDLATAVEKALAGPGAALGAALEREDGRAAYAVHVVRGGRRREVTLDARSGAVLDDDEEKGDPAALAAACKVPLAAAIRSALAKVPGTALEAEANLRDGRATAEIEIVLDGRGYEVQVDLGTGAVLSVSRED